MSVSMSPYVISLGLTFIQFPYICLPSVFKLLDENGNKNKHIQYHVIIAFINENRPPDVL